MLLNCNVGYIGDGINGIGNCSKVIGVEICYSKLGGVKYYVVEKLVIKFVV